MTSFQSRLAVLLSAFALACGGGSTSSEPAASGGGEEHGEGHGHHHSTGVPELDALHEELAAVWHGDHGEACAHADSFHTHAAAVRVAAAPAAADPAAWSSAADALVSTSDALSAECTAAGPAVEERLSTFHDAFHAAMDCAGGGHDDEDHASDEHHDEDHEVDEAAAHARGQHHDHDGESDEHAHH